MERKRTVEWQDPSDGARAALKMTGMEYLKSMWNGTLPFPPLLQTLDFEVLDSAPGNIIFRFQPEEFHYNPIGTVHGGVISAILDSAIGCSIHSLLPAGKGYTTLELKVNFLKAVTIKSGRMKTTAKVIHIGARTALAEAQLLDENEQIFAHAVSTCMILKF